MQLFPFDFQRCTLRERDIKSKGKCVRGGSTAVSTKRFLFFKYDFFDREVTLRDVQI